MAVNKEKNKNKKVFFKSDINSTAATQLRMKRRNNQQMLSRTDTDMDDYCLDRLFDPEELHYTPMPVLLKRYAKRDLRVSRTFNLAKKYGEYYEKRHRVIQAPQMQRAGQRIFGTENFYVPPVKRYFCTQPRLLKTNDSLFRDDNDDDEEAQQEHGEIEQSEDGKISYDDESNDDDNNDDMAIENFGSYTARLGARKTLRNGLNHLDLNLDYLERKPELNEIEKKILRQMKFIDRQMQTESIRERKQQQQQPPLKGLRSRASQTPKSKYPTPAAMTRIEQFLETNKWRLLDFFKDLDKNKDGKVYKDDFLRKCKTSDLKISKEMIDEIVKKLGKGGSNKLDYKALADGRLSHLSERRSVLRESRLSTSRSSEIRRNKNEGLEESISPEKEEFSPPLVKLPADFPISRTQSSSTFSSDSTYVKLPLLAAAKPPFRYPQTIKEKPDGFIHKPVTYVDKGVSALSVTHHQIQKQEENVDTKETKKVKSSKKKKPKFKMLEIKESEINKLVKLKKSQIIEQIDSEYVNYLSRLESNANKERMASAVEDELSDFEFDTNLEQEKALRKGLYPPRDSSVAQISDVLKKKASKVKAMMEAGILEDQLHRSQLKTSSTLKEKESPLLQ